MALRAAKEERSSSVGLVVGLTNAGSEVLTSIPDVPLLIPGLGAQGGDLSTLAQENRQAPNLINVSRGVLYPSNGISPAEAAINYQAAIRDALS